jgi:PAS domain S-box-containing protein
VVLRDEEGKVLKFVGTTTDIDDQKRAEEALRESEHESRLIVDSIPGMVAVISTSGEVMFLSKPILDYYGKSLDEVNSQWTTGDMIHREDRPGLIQAFTRSLASGDPTEVELRARRFDGVYRWFDLRGRPLRDRHGQIVRWYFLQTDIDDRKRAEEKLREREHESRLIVDSIPGLIAVLDTSGEVERVNQPLLDYLGRSLEELRQWAVDDTIHPDDRPGYLQAFERAFATGDAVEYDAARIRRFDGVYRWLNIRGRPLRDREGHIVRWYFLLTEVDDRKRAEEKLRESEYESRLIVDSIPGLIAVLGASGELERLNQPMLDYLGKSLEESRQWAVDGTVHPDDRPAYLQTFAESFAAGVPFEYEAVRTRRFDGVYRWLNMRGLPLRDRQGHIVRWYFLLADVDDRKRAEEALRQAQRDLARISRVTTMGELAASLAHEVSQPISGTMTNANACLRSLGSDRPDVDLVRTAVTRIVRDAQRAVEIIGRIRSQFEKGAPDREVIDVNEVNRETVALLRDEAIRYNILVRTELAADLPQIVGDRVQLQQVVMNLIVNSIDAMKEVEGMREMVIASQPAEDGQILVSVSDTGIGLPQQLAERIFDPFFTTKPHGTGMGLRISRSIIESHGGRLWAVGSSGRGATFHLKLPAAVPDMRTGAGGTA